MTPAPDAGAAEHPVGGGPGPVGLPSAAEVAAALTPAGGDPVTRPAAERGRTTLADRVVEKTVAGAVAELEAGGGADRVVTVARSRTSRTPRVKVEIHGRALRIAMDLAVLYPAPLRRVAAETRRHVAQRVGELTGLDVKEVDLTVVTLPLPGARP